MNNLEQRFIEAGIDLKSPLKLYAIPFQGCFGSGIAVTVSQNNSEYTLITPLNISDLKNYLESLKAKYPVDYKFSNDGLPEGTKASILTCPFFEPGKEKPKVRDIVQLVREADRLMSKDRWTSKFLEWVSPFL